MKRAGIPPFHAVRFVTVNQVIEGVAEFERGLAAACKDG